MRADPDRVEDSDIYLMHALANVGIDDDHIWNAIQRSHEDDVAYFTVAGSCDLSGSNPPGWVGMQCMQCNKIKDQREATRLK
jgi:hypothetical protein